jgi:hypothetical protein
MGNSHPSKDRLSAPKTRRFELRLSEQELKQFLELEKSLAISRSDIVRIRVLKNAANNINQLARHANILHKQGLLSQSVATEFNSLLGEYNTIQQELEKVIRQIIRLMKG